MAKLWIDSLTIKSKWWCEFDNKRSDYESWRLQTKNISDVSGKARIIVKPKKLSSFVQKHFVLNGVRVPLVNRTVKDVLIKNSSSPLRFLPTDVVCKDDVISDYGFVSPLDFRSVTDLQRTRVLNWFVKDKYIDVFDHLHIHHDRVGDWDIVRDEHSSHFLVVGEKMSDLLLSQNFSGLCLETQENVAHIRAGYEKEHEEPYTL